MNKRPVRICECGNHAWAPLTLGHTTLVDVDHAHLLEMYSWSASVRPNGAKKVYAQAKANSRHLLLHHMIIGVPIKPLIIDHKSEDGLDNRSANLRVTSKSINGLNVRGRKNNTSGYTGVRLDKRIGLWSADIMVNGKAKFLGYFDDPKTASDVYQKHKEAIMSTGGCY